MKPHRIFGVLGIILLFNSLFAGNVVAPTIEKFSTKMTIRTLNKGISTSVTADVFYQSDGKMVTHFISPNEFILFSNSLGEIKMYDPAQNTVLVDQNIIYSSETSNFYYFFTDESNSFGLKKMGFSKSKTSFDDGLMINEWTPPAEISAQLKSVEVAYEGSQPVYIGYQDKDNKTVKKIYFYDFKPVGGIKFPTSVTEINYMPGYTDSIIAKTTYTDFATNNDVDMTYLNYKIPDNAKAQ